MVGSGVRASQGVLPVGSEYEGGLTPSLSPAVLPPDTGAEGRGHGLIWQQRGGAGGRGEEQAQSGGEASLPQQWKVGSSRPRLMRGGGGMEE